MRKCEICETPLNARQNTTCSRSCAARRTNAIKNQYKRDRSVHERDSNVTVLRDHNDGSSYGRYNSNEQLLWDKIETLKDEKTELRIKINALENQLLLQKIELEKPNIIEKALGSEPIVNGLMGIFSQGANTSQKQGLQGVSHNVVKAIEENPSIENFFDISLKGFKNIGEPFQKDFYELFKKHKLI